MKLVKKNSCSSSY